MVGERSGEEKCKLTWISEAVASGIQVNLHFSSPPLSDQGSSSSSNTKVALLKINLRIESGPDDIKIAPSQVPERDLPWKKRFSALLKRGVPNVTQPFLQLLSLELPPPP